jgi:hypothetical protein
MVMEKSQNPVMIQFWFYKRGIMVYLAQYRQEIYAESQSDRLSKSCDAI